MSRSGDARREHRVLRHHHSGIVAAGALALGFAAVPAVGQGVPQANPDDVRLVEELGLQESEQRVSEMIEGWKKPRKIVVRVDKPERIAWLQEAAPGVTLVPVTREGSRGAEVLSLVADADALVGVIGGCNEQTAKAGKRLNWIHADSAGVDHCAPYLSDRDNILLTNMQKVFGPEISDHVIALMFGLTRGLDSTMKLQMQKKWVRGAGVSPERLWEIEDRTMFVAGLGGIGTAAGRKAHALGMRVIGTRRSSREGPDFVEHVGLADETATLVGQADVVVNALPLTDETRGLFDAAMFARMKPGAYYISVGRGGTTVTDDLIAALRSGHLGGAGLDVTDPEPLPDGHPLWSAPNIIITPHSSSLGVGLSVDGERAWQVMREQIRRYVAGEKIYNVVDIDAGY
jgi:phosphoglycerate dehydrogenase-like enzyme